MTHMVRVVEPTKKDGDKLLCFAPVEAAAHINARVAETQAWIMLDGVMHSERRDITAADLQNIAEVYLQPALGGGV